MRGKQAVEGWRLKKPLAIELFAGRFGWGKGFVSEGFRVIGFDIVHEEWHKPVPEGCELVLQDVLTLHGRQFKDAAVIVASPPCQAYSYRAMPWKRAKALPPPSNELFDACFRIQREASEAAGRYIPMVVENVKGAQPWVGTARWHYGSFYLWGDVPALMPPIRRGVMKLGVAHRSNGETNFHGSAERASIKVPGLNWSGSDKPGYVAKAFNGTAVKRLAAEGVKGTGGTWFTPQNSPDSRGSTHGGDWFSGTGTANGMDKSPMRLHSSKSKARKMASAAIAEIPAALAQHVARIFHP